MKRLLRNMRHTLMIVFILFTRSLTAQSEDSQNTEQLWLEFIGKKTINTRLDFSTKFGAKTIYPRSWYRFYIKPKVSYLRPKRIFKQLNFEERLEGGIDIYYNNNFNQSDIFEIAFNQGYSLQFPNKSHFYIRHSLELKERFQFNMENWQSIFGLQLTYEASLVLRFNRLHNRNSPGFFFPFKFKVYWNMVDAKLFNDVVKFRSGIGYQITRQWKTLFLIGYNYIKDLDSTGFNSDSTIFQFQVSYKLN